MDDAANNNSILMFNMYGTSLESISFENIIIDKVDEEEIIKPVVGVLDFKNNEDRIIIVTSTNKH